MLLYKVLLRISRRHCAQPFGFQIQHRAMAAVEESSQLIETASSTLALLQRCTAALVEKTDSSAPRIADAPDPLDVIHDASKLLKAHTTKLSLLVINKPFTPSASLILAYKP